MPRKLVFTLHAFTLQDLVTKCVQGKCGGSGQWR